MDMTTRAAPETKAATGAHGHEVGEAFDEFLSAFEAFKEANDERLTQIETRMSADVVTVDKMERINRALDEHKSLVDGLVLKARRPGLSGEGREASHLQLQHKAAFEAYVRKGAEGELSRLEGKAMSVASNPDGGYLVPEETEAEIGRLMSQASPIRAIADVRQMSASTYRKPFAISGFASGWVGETANRPQTTSATLDELTFPAMELYAMPAATQTLLDDSAVDLDRWIAEEVQTAFAEQEGAAFVTGDGSAKPTGFLSYTNVAEASWAWDKIGYVASGSAGGVPRLEPVGQADRPRLRAEVGLPAERALRDEPDDARGDPQVQGRRRQLYLAAGGDGGREREPARLPRGRGRGHAGHRRRRHGRSPSATSAAAT